MDQDKQRDAVSLLGIDLERDLFDPEDSEIVVLLSDGEDQGSHPSETKVETGSMASPTRDRSCLRSRPEAKEEIAPVVQNTGSNTVQPLGTVEQTAAVATHRNIGDQGPSTSGLTHGTERRREIAFESEVESASEEQFGVEEDTVTTVRDYNVFKKIGVVDVDFPGKSLDNHRKMKIGANLLRLMAKLESEGSPCALKIMDANVKDSGIVIACYDRASMKFLKDSIAKICPMATATGREEDCRLRVIDVESMRACVQVVTFIPSTAIKDTEVIDMLRATNPEQKFDTSTWRLVRTGRRGSRGITVVLNVDYGSFKKIKKTGVKLWFGLNRISLKRSGEGN